MPPTPSPTYERLRDTIAKRMRMSHVDQPLMLMERLGRRSPAPAQDVARRILGGGRDPDRALPERVKRMVGKVLTGNGITRYDQGAPASLYWYGRSASGMPLLQFLAFYQVVEFYFPVYAEAEAKRKLMAILKGPTFRGDREADIGRLLTVIQGSRTGSLGSELQQLKSTVNECVDHQDLREFFFSDEDRRTFYASKQKYHKIPISNPDPNFDLRADAAARIYDIRCGIVHTKNNSSDDVHLLLPFSNEADDLAHDIGLMEFVAKSVLIAASVPFGIGG